MLWKAPRRCRELQKMGAWKKSVTWVPIQFLTALSRHTGKLKFLVQPKMEFKWEI